MALSHTNRGKSLEDLINFANDQYRARGIADITKQAVPARFLPGGKVIPGKATVDYEGTWNGRKIAFDAKQTQGKSFQLRNVRPHQYAHLAKVHNEGGIACLLVEMSTGVFLIPWSLLEVSWQRWRFGGRASISAEELDALPRVTQGRGIVLDYLATIEAERAREGAAG